MCGKCFACASSGVDCGLLHLVLIVVFDFVWPLTGGKREVRRSKPIKTWDLAFYLRSEEKINQLIHPEIGSCKKTMCPAGCIFGLFMQCSGM